jgi:argininosuccinate lyase
MLVRKGVNFRQAHEIVARIVRFAIEEDKALSQLTTKELASFSDVLDSDYYAVLDRREWLESKGSEGGTASERLSEQLATARSELEAMGD